MLLSIKEYAKQKSITYEAVRKQINRYEKELKGKIIQKGRTKFLSDAAIDFLDERRANSPVIVYKQQEKTEQENQRSELEDLRVKYTAMLEKLAAIQEAHKQEQLALNGKIEALYQKQVELLEANTKKHRWFWQK